MAKKKSSDPGKYNARKGKYGLLGSYFKDHFAAQRGADADHAANPWMTGGQKADQLAEVEALKTAKKGLLGLDRQLQEVAQRRAAVEMGLYGRHLRATQQYHAELKKVVALETQARRTQLYGRFGAGVAAFAESPQGRLLGSFGGAALATGSGLATRGVAGTVEGSRISYEIELISRSLAGAFKPAIDEVIGGLTGFRKLLDGMSAGQQKWLMRGGLLAAGGYAANRMGLLGPAAQAAASVAGKLPYSGLGGTMGMIGAAGLIGLPLLGAMAPRASRGLGQQAINDGWTGEQLQVLANLHRQDEGPWSRFRASLTENIIGNTADALVYTGLLKGKRKDFRVASEQYQEAADFKLGREAEQNRKNRLTLPGGELNDIGNTFFETMKAAGSLTSDGKDESTLGQILDVLRERLPPAAAAFDVPAGG